MWWIWLNEDLVCLTIVGLCNILTSLYLAKKQCQMGSLRILPNDHLNPIRNGPMAGWRLVVRALGIPSAIFVLVLPNWT